MSKFTTPSNAEKKTSLMRMLGQVAVVAVLAHLTTGHRGIA